MNLRVALYVKRLVVNIWRGSWESPARQVKFINSHFILSEKLNDGIIYFHKPYAEIDMQIFEQVVKRNEYAFGNDMFEALIKGIRDGREDPIVALLLLLLTNLKYLVVTNMGDHPHFSQALQHVSNARDAEALRCLSEVELLNQSRYGDDNLLMVKAFATLPSVKRISGQRISNAANHRRVKFDLPPRSSNVESLTYHCCNERDSGVDTVTFSELIKGFKGLERLSYDSDSDHKMFAIRNALVANARFSLGTLILKPRIPTRKSIGSFRGFKALKKLEIDHMHLADFDPRGNIYSVDILPSSLEELHLHYYHRKGLNDNSVRMDPLRIGQKLLEERDRHVPNLKLVALYDDYFNYPYGLRPDLDAAAPGIAELQATFIAKGLRLEILDSRVLTRGGIPSHHFMYFGNFLLHAPFEEGLVGVRYRYEDEFTFSMAQDLHTFVFHLQPLTHSIFTHTEPVAPTDTPLFQSISIRALKPPFHDVSRLLHLNRFRRGRAKAD